MTEVFDVTADRPFSVKPDVEARIARAEKPYRDETVLRTLYHERGMSLREIAGVCQCSKKTVLNWMERHEIERRSAGRPRKNHATYRIGPRGYAQWQVNDPDGTKVNVFVHQLLAIHQGEDPRDVFDDSTQVHHRTAVKRDNRPGAVEVVSRSQHKRTHLADQWQYDEGLGCMVLKTAPEQPTPTAGTEGAIEVAG